MNKNAALIFSLIFCALIVQAQDTPKDAPKDTTWETDPLDVLESKEKPAPAQPAVPEFTEIPEPGTDAGNGKTEVPPSELGPMETEKAAETLKQESFPQPVPPHDVPAEVTTEPKIEETLPATKAVSSQQVAVPTSDGEPDYSKESEFHRIYKTYNEQPTSDEAWEKAASNAKESKVYKIQKGDTLSGISQTFFGDPFYWPKVWSLNHGKILNPHEIVPGLNVQFFPGSMEEAPSLSLAQEAKKGEEAPVKAEQESAASKRAEVEMPPSTKKRTPLLKTIPGSLPAYRMGVNRKEGLELQIGGSKVVIAQAPEYVSYYINDTPMEGVGIVTGTELSMKTAGDYQYLYVRLDGNQEGKYLIAQKNVGPVSDSLRKGRQGHMVEVQGEIEILERVNDAKNIFRAIVKKTLQPIEVGAMLTPGKMPMFNPSVGELNSGVGAKIMGGQFDRKRTLFGSSSLVFLDAGAGQGLQEGQVLPIFADLKKRNKNLEAVTNDRMIGVIKVVRVSNNFATAYIAKATDDILLGDYVGKSTALALREDEPVEVEQKAAPVNENFEKDFEEEGTAAPSESPEPSSGTDDSEIEL